VVAGALSGRLLYSLANMDADRWELWEYNFATGSSSKVGDWRTEVDISKDGNQIAYYAWAGDVGEPEEGVWIMDGDFTNNREVIGGGAYPSFSPGGDRLALNGGLDIYVINTDGSGLRQLTRGEYGAWSPVNDEIVHRACVGGSCGLYAINANSEDANAKRRLTEGASDGQPAWSPDGSRIAYISQEEGNFEIYIINADGTGKIRLTNEPASDGLPVWSPDGQWIAFRSDRSGEWAIYVVRPDGSGLSKVTDANVLERWFFEKMDWRQ
jgi:TolB protein